jgi:gustatory receptor
MYGLQFLFLIVSTFIEITINLYYSVSVMMCGTEVSVHNVFNILLPIIWTLIYFVQLFFITGSCSSASYEANPSVALLQKLLLVLELNADTASEISLFLSQVVHRHVRFAAWDFFSINYTILDSIVGSVTTLLVILVQFQTLP